jgi:hypothetical protein
MHQLKSGKICSDSAISEARLDEKMCVRRFLLAGNLLLEGIPDGRGYILLFVVVSDSLATIKEYHHSVSRQSRNTITQSLNNQIMSSLNHSY